MYQTVTRVIACNRAGLIFSGKEGEFYWSEASGDKSKRFDKFEDALADAELFIRSYVTLSGKHKAEEPANGIPA